MLDGWFVVSSNKFINFWYSIIILYYINLRSLIVLCLSYGDIYLPLSISSSFVSELFYGKVYEAIVIVSKLSFPSVAFLIALLEGVSSAYLADCLAWSQSLWLYLLLQAILENIRSPG